MGVGVELSNVKRRKTLVTRDPDRARDVRARSGRTGQGRNGLTIRYRRGPRRITSTFTTRTGNTHDVVIGTMTEEQQNVNRQNRERENRLNTKRFLVATAVSQGGRRDALASELSIYCGSSARGPPGRVDVDRDREH